MKTAAQRGKELHSILQSIRLDYSNKRQQMTQRMLECWAVYLGTPESQDYLRANAIHKTVGDVQKDWRHRVNNGKGYEIVETVVGYLMAATFPNLDWFDMIPETPMPEEVDYIKFILPGQVRVLLATASCNRNLRYQPTLAFRD